MTLSAKTDHLGLIAIIPYGTNKPGSNFRSILVLMYTLSPLHLLASRSLQTLGLYRLPSIEGWLSIGICARKRYINRYTES